MAAVALTGAALDRALAKKPEKQRLFVAEYPLDFEGRAAAIRAGYAERSAKVTASQLLDDPVIAAAVDRELASRLRRLHVTADRIFLEATKVAFADLGVYFEWDDARGMVLVPKAELPAGATAAIQALEVELVESEDPVTKAVTIRTKTKLKLHDKKAAWVLLLKYMLAAGVVDAGQVRERLRATLAVLRAELPPDEAERVARLLAPVWGGA